MSSDRRPWFPWYPRDFGQDEKVRCLSDDAELLYRRALDVMWQANTLQLPSNCLKLANALARGWQKERFEKAWNEIQTPGFELFKTTNDGEYIYSSRLLREANKIEELSNKRKRLGKKGAEARAKQLPSKSQAKAKATAKQQLSHTDTYTDIKDKEVSIDTSSANLPEKTIIDFPTNKADENFFVTSEFMDEMTGLFPAVNVDQELKKMKAWLIANQKKRKTKAGIPKFIVAWLSKEQDRGGSKSYQPGNGSGTKPVPTTYAQCQDAERRSRAFRVLEYMEENKNG